MPSSSSRAHICAGARSQYSGERSTVKTCCRSASVSLFGGAGRGDAGPAQVVAAADSASHATRPKGRTPRWSTSPPRTHRSAPRSSRRLRIDVRALREPLQERVQFPMTSSADLVLASSAAKRSFRRRSRSSSTCSTDRFAFAFGARASRAPPSRALRHSDASCTSPPGATTRPAATNRPGTRRTHRGSGPRTRR
jgi:hypothetical protein